MRNALKQALAKAFRAAGFSIIRQESLDRILSERARDDEVRRLLLARRPGAPELEGTVPGQLSSIRRALDALDEIAAQYGCAADQATKDRATQFRSLAEHYRASAETLADEFVFAGAKALRDNFSDDDGTLDYAKRQNIYYPTPGGEATIDAGRPECGIFLVCGQSNAANHGGGSHRARPGVYSLNFFDLRCYAADDPLPGASGNGASPWPILGDLLIERSLFKRVLFVPVAFAGTYAIDWTKDGPIRHRLTLALTRLQKRLGVHMIGFDGVFWQQGEAEANLTELAASQYRAQLGALFADFRQYGVYCPIFVTRSSICEGPAPHPFKNHAAIRQAQHEVVDLSRAIVAGPDTDRISGAGRSDGCHFSAEGIRQAASLWLESIEGSRQFLGKGLPPTFDQSQLPTGD
jgi:hypothetical protein